MKVLRKIKKCLHPSKQRNSPKIKIGLFFILNKEKTEPISSISSVSLEWLWWTEMIQWDTSRNTGQNPKERDKSYKYFS